MASNVLPQLNIVDFEPQIIWLLITFCVFYVIIKLRIVPYFDLETENRSKKIHNNYQEAKKLQLKADRLAHDYNEKIHAVHLRANDLISEAKLKASTRVKSEKKRLNSEMIDALNLEVLKLQKEFQNIENELLLSRDLLKEQAKSKVFVNDNRFDAIKLGGLT